MKPLRFCMVTTFYPPYHFGGDAIFVRALARNLVGRGHHVEVVHCEDAFRLRGGEVAAVPDDGVHVHRLRSRLGPLSPLITQQTGRPGLKRWALRRILEQPFDVIHFHNVSLVGGPAVLAMGRAPMKLYTPHEFWLFCPVHVLWQDGRRPCERPHCLRCCLRSRTPPQLWRYTGLIQRSLRHLDCLLALSRFSAERHRQAGIACPIQVLPIFADVEPPAPAPDAPGARPRFLYVGRLTPSKGVLALARAFQCLPNFDLDIAGTGELLAELQRLAASSPNLRVLGGMSTPEVLSLYPGATATVFPSQGPEIAGLVPLESMACGTPVVAHEAGGSAEAVAATGGGVVYRSSAELLPILRRLVADTAWRDQLAGDARRGYLEQFSAQVHVDRYLEIIRGIAERKAQP